MFNPILEASLLAWFIAQLLKILITAIQDKKFDFVKFWSSGGMPSSHSSTVCALATACAYVYGHVSPYFAISAILAVVVMYDAAGVRRAVGEQAKVLNFINATSVEDGEPGIMQKALKELIGHTPLQVVFGALLGILMGIFYPMLCGIPSFYAA
ncbi:MAG: divergent PAP2 family protein [Clostridia bacterium]|nr:divergent PAP2 family protein [Clostridia bacterium]